MKNFLLIIIILLNVSVYAQQTILGVIVDQSEQPLADAYVFINSGSEHGHTNALGKFKLARVNVGDTLRVNFLGYEDVRYILRARDFENILRVEMKEEVIDLSQVSVSNSVKAINTVSSIDLKTNPVRSSQEVLRRVPGLFIGQHAGGGKAEQIFLRGFDIDHGTDITISVDGLPVNMVSHAHGQGYSDLHFLIPETIENIDFGKGPYYTDIGNFNTAGYVNFKTRDRLDNSVIGLEFGDFNTFRTVGLFDLLGQDERNDAYIATEYIQTDGPFESSQNFTRLNLFGKYSMNLSNGDRLSFTMSRFQSQWDASGQIPQRLIDDGTISRFGAVDDTEGGRTSRTNIAIDHTKVIDDNTFLKTSAYFSHYDFELFSNFTFFLEDPENGDQIRQTEDRRIYGLNATLFQGISMSEADLEMSYGVGLRYDDVNDNELSRTANRRTTLERLAFGDVDESNIFGFVNAELDFGKWLISGGIRLDVFDFNYIDKLALTYTNLSETESIISPKLNVIYNPNPNWQLFIKAGKGFHSNDSRVSVARSRENILPAAYGADFGMVWKPTRRLLISPALWYLYLEQEFVYVGDAGIVEPSGETVRRGIDLSVRYQLGKYIFLDGDLNYTIARAINEPEGADHIPLAPELTSIGGITVKLPSGFSGSLRYRYIRDRPANEDNTIIAKGYFVTDLNLNYTFNKVSLGVTVENLFDVDWNEAQFATESQLLNELEPVEELHLTPGTPFYIRGGLRYSF